MSKSYSDHVLEQTAYLNHKAYLEGESAWHHGICVPPSEYYKGCSEYMYWLDGWNDAQRNYERQMIVC